MTQEEIIEMVMQIGGCDRPEEDSPALKMFVTFAHLVATKEREACEHDMEVLMNALWKACGDDAEVVNATIESQGELTRARGEQA